MDKFTDYQSWHHAITKRGGFTLDKVFCEERIVILKNDEEPSTKSFLNSYSREYRDQVISWFEQALREA